MYVLWPWTNFMIWPWFNDNNKSLLRRGGLVVNTLAYHTGDPGSIPGRGGSSEKCESIWGDFSSPACNPPSLITGVYKRDWWGRANYLCSHCFLWPGTIKSWWKPSPGQTDQLHTLQHSTHTCIHKWREGIKRVMHSAPKKIVGLWGMLKEGRPGRIFSYGLLVNESFECNIKYSQQIQLKVTGCPNWKNWKNWFHISLFRIYLDFSWKAFPSAPGWVCVKLVSHLCP